MLGLLLPGTSLAQPDRDGDGGGPLESLDALLGLEDDEATDAGSRSLPELSDAALDRALSQAEASQAFEQAAGLMRESAQRLTELADAGIATQRLQEDILRKLDAVIEAAKQNQQNSSSSSSSSSNQNQSQEQPSQPQASSSSPGGENTTEQDSPGRQDGALRTDLEATAATWGALPDRVRESLSQGVSDRYSALYERLTEAYYRALAERAGEGR